MKNGRWIAGLLLALFARDPLLFAQEGRWQAVDNPPAPAAPGVTLDRPVAVKSQAVSETPLAVSAPSEILPVNYETTTPAAPRSAIQPAAASAPRRPAPEIIAVSAPVQRAVEVPFDDEEEPIESLFATDRPLRPIPPRRGPVGSIRQAAASSSVPMVAGWEAPVDTGWLGAPPPSFNAPQPGMLGMNDGGGVFGPNNGDGTMMGPAGNPLMGRRFYVGGEYLLWWLQGQRTPVLATTSSPSDFGILGAPSTQVLFGGNGINSGPFSGGRFWAGYWLTCKTALEVNGFFLGQRSANFSVNSITNPVIGRPFLEANNGQESAQLTALPGVTAGALTINSPTNLWGLGANLRCLLCCGCNYNIYALAGFRNINLDEKLTLQEDIQGLPTAPPPFTKQTITVLDSFRTQNHFYGGNLGLGALWYRGRWSVNANAQVALGDNVQILDINGSQRFVSPAGQVQNFTGGLLALPSNIGHFSNNAFSVVPEVGINLGYNFTPSLRAFVGYNFLYWSNVIRPGTSIDRSLDVTQIPNFPINPEPAPVPGQHPAPVFHQVGFWAQGISFGLQYVY
jgi:hypothetical protein